MNENEVVYSVYKHTSPSNKVYIGITSMSPPEKRWKNGFGYWRNKHFYNAIQKYGWDNIKHEILFEGLSKEEAENKEMELIALYDAANKEKGYNNDNGGSSTGRLTSETKKKISDAAKERLQRPENHPLYGKHRSEETKRKLSEHNKELFSNPTNNPNYGNTKKIIDLDTKIIYDSAYEVSDKFGVSVDNIRANCRGDIRTCGSGLYRFKYLKDWEIQGEEAINKEFLEYVYPSSIPVRCIELDIIYKSATIAGRELGIDNTAITAVCKGRKYHKTAGKLPDGTKLHWEYVS